MSRLNQAWKVCRVHLRTHPLLRGMLTYAVSWSTGSLVQQTFESKGYDFSQTLKFGLYGSLYVAPTLYGWMRVCSMIWPHPKLSHALIKAGLEQVTYSPFALCSFFFVITFLDEFSVQRSIEEIKEKLIPTWKVSASVWPAIQTVNYLVIPERNRIPFIGMCSLCWTIFLAYTKYHKEKLKNT